MKYLVATHVYFEQLGVEWDGMCGWVVQTSIVLGRQSKQEQYCIEHNSKSCCPHQHCDKGEFCLKRNVWVCHQIFAISWNGIQGLPHKNHKKVHMTIGQQSCDERIFLAILIAHTMYYLALHWRRQCMVASDDGHWVLGKRRNVLRLIVTPGLLDWKIFKRPFGLIGFFQCQLHTKLIVFLNCTRTFQRHVVVQHKKRTTILTAAGMYFVYVQQCCCRNGPTDQRRRPHLFQYTKSNRIVDRFISCCRRYQTFFFLKKEKIKPNKGIAKVVSTNPKSTKSQEIM